MPGLYWIISKQLTVSPMPTPLYQERASGRHFRIRTTKFILLLAGCRSVAARRCWGRGGGCRTEAGSLAPGRVPWNGRSACSARGSDHPQVPGRAGNHRWEPSSLTCLTHERIKVSIKGALEGSGRGGDLLQQTLSLEEDKGADSRHASPIY